MANTNQKLFCLFTALITSSYNALYTADTAKPLLINLHGVNKEIKNIEACSLDQWRNKPAYACECCLLEQQNELGVKGTADEAIQACKKAGLCTDASLAEVSKRAGVKQGAQEELLKTLYDDAVVIRTMHIDKTLLSGDGKFTESTLPQFLEQAYREGKLNNADFRKASCLKAKDIAAQGGANTAQLFLVTATCNASQASLYILKGATEGLGEAIKLKDLEVMPAMQAIIAPRVVPGLPSISLPIAYFAYPNKSGMSYISAMPAAKGKEFGALILALKDDQSKQNWERVNRGFRILGKEVANFHKRFMEPIPGRIIGKTMIHGDLHPFNVFYDEIGGHFTFIDNETMTRTMNKKSTLYPDLIKLSLTPIHIGKLFRELTEGMNLKQWYDNAFKNLIVGYTEAYEPQERVQVLKELKYMFNADHPLLGARYQVKRLPEFREKYINPVFDALIAGTE